MVFTVLILFIKKKKKGREREEKWDHNARTKLFETFDKKFKSLLSSNNEIT